MVADLACLASRGLLHAATQPRLPACPSPPLRCSHPQVVADLAHLAAQPKQRSHPGAEKSVRLAVSMLVKTVLQVGGCA